MLRCKHEIQKCNSAFYEVVLDRYAEGIELISCGVLRGPLPLEQPHLRARVTKVILKAILTSSVDQPFSAVCLILTSSANRQRERERAIRDEFSKLHGLLPWSKDVAHSKRDILRNAISYIDTLENKIREIRRGMETVWTSCKEKSAQGAASYDNMASGFAKSKGTEAFADTKEEFSVAPEPLTPGMDCLAALLSSVGNGNVSTSKEKNRIKRPMNAFLLFSKKHRKIYQERYPGRDNRKISTLMAEDWNKMEEGTKKPYRDEAHEEMKKKRENPRFRYSETKKTPQGAVVRATEKDGSDGFR